MSKIDRLNARVAKLLTEAVQEVLELVKDTVSEYQEKTARTQRENERLRFRLRDALDKLEKQREESSLCVLSGSVDPATLQQQSHGQTWNPSRSQEMESMAAVETPVKGENGGVSEACRSTESLTADPETVCDLSVALTLVPENGSHSSHSALSLGTSHGSKHDERADNTCTVKAAPINMLSPNLTEMPPPIAAEDIKKEPDSLGYSASQQQILQSGIDFAEDLSVTTAGQEPVVPNMKSSESATGSYGLVFIHSNHNTLTRRFGCGRGARATLDGRRQKLGQGREEQHVCVVCGKTFSRVGNLRIHQRCHTGEKPYRCLQCGRCFTQAGDLKKHKRVHTGEKPYYCGHCGKSFSRGENLKRHQKIHIGERLQLQHTWRGAQTN